MQILYSYFRYTGRLFLGCALLLLPAILSELYKKPRWEKDWSTEKKLVKKRICVREITFLTARSPFHVIFCCFLSLLPFPWRTSWMTPIKIHNIAMDCILWCRKNENLLQFSTSWLASLRTWYYFRHFLASAFLPIYCYCYYINYK